MTDDDEMLREYMRFWYIALRLRAYYARPIILTANPGEDHPPL